MDGFPDKMPKMEDVPELLQEWRRRLRLEDWEISIKFERHCECLGNVRMSAKYKHAEIVIREPDFVDPDNLGNKDLEVTLVHELLHVQGGHMTQFLAEKGNERYYDDMERVVELTAIALVNLRRRVETVEEANRRLEVRYEQLKEQIERVKIRPDKVRK